MRLNPAGKIIVTAVLSLSCGGAASRGPNVSSSRAAPPQCADGSLATTNIRVSRMALGAKHSCALGVDGAVWCWGDNRKGQVGDGTLRARSRPREILPPTSAVAVTAGDTHTCVIDRGGTVRCWGNNEAEQLGDGSYVCRSDQCIVKQLTPRTVRGISRAKAIAAGASATCALVEGGAVWCWGGVQHDIERGEVVAKQSGPVRVARLPDEIDEITAGGDEACARTRSGAVSCWPLRDEDGFSASAVTSARSGVSALALTEKGRCFVRDGSARCTATDDSREVDFGPAAQLAAKGAHACSVDARGQIRCWQVTDGQESVRVIEGPSGVGSIAVGSEHACAVDREQRPMCWGSNDAKQIGNGHATVSQVWSRIEGLPPTTSVTVADEMVCAVARDGRAFCWGNVGGDAPSAFVAKPVAIVGLSGVTSLTSGGSYVCAVDASFATRCWGKLTSLMGDKKGEAGAAPVRLPLPPLRSVIADDRTVCGIDEARRATCWRIERDRAPVVEATFDDVKAFAVRRHVVGVIRTDGTVQLADEGRPLHASTSGIVEFGADFFGLIARTSSGGLLSLSMGRTVTWEAVPNVSDAVALRGACARLQNGEWRCAPGSGKDWDDLGAPDAVAIDFAGGAECVVTERGEVWCRGDNLGGRLGLGTSSFHARPVTVQ